MPRLAIVISAVGSIEALEGTLLSVLENRPADCEIIVALNQPYADPYALRDEVRFVEATRKTSVISGIQGALSSSRAPFLHLLSSGCQVTEGWADEAIARFGDRQLASIAPVVRDARAHELIFAAGVGYRRGGGRYLVGQGLRELPPAAEASIVGACHFAGFYRKAAIDFVGGLSTQLGPRQADVDLALTLKRAGFSVGLEPLSCIYAGPEADAGESAFRQALHDERLFWRNLPARGRLTALAAHGSLMAVEVLRGLPRPQVIARLFARALACGQLSGHARHRRALAQLSQRAILPKSHSERVRIDRSHGVPAHSQAAKARINAH